MSWRLGEGPVNGWNLTANGVSTSAALFFGFVGPLRQNQYRPFCFAQCHLWRCPSGFGVNRGGRCGADTTTYRIGYWRYPKHCLTEIRRRRVDLVRGTL